MSLALSYAATCLVQAGAVLVPARVPQLPAALRGRAFALVPPLAIAVAVAAIVLEPDVAEWLTNLAAVATPPLALAAALVARRPRVTLAAAIVALVVAFAADGLAGEIGRAVAIALACAPLGVLLAAAAPPLALEAAIVATAVVDVWLVAGGQISEAAGALASAVPPAGLPRFQDVRLGDITMGWGDVFLASVLGAAMLRRGGSQTLAAAVVTVFGAAFGLLFVVVDTLPATVPIAVAVLVCETRLRLS